MLMVGQSQLKFSERNLNFVKSKVDIKNMSIFLFWREINLKKEKL